MLGIFPRRNLWHVVMLCLVKRNSAVGKVFLAGGEAFGVRGEALKRHTAFAGVHSFPRYPRFRYRPNGTWLFSQRFSSTKAVWR
jgi:hypothetical protein